MYNNSPTTSNSFDNAHKVTSNSTNSIILEQIKLWYTNSTNLSTLIDKIDVDTGFCSDTSLATGNHGSYTGNGYGTSRSGYAALDRIWQTDSTGSKYPQTPTLKCGTDETSRKRDLYTGPNATNGGTKGSNGSIVEGNNALPVPVGLITMDEVIYAGGFFGGNANGRYWLYTNQYYWTMTPSYYDPKTASVFIVNTGGNLDEDYSVGSDVPGARPVINLKADITFEEGGDGTASNPFVVKTK